MKSICIFLGANPNCKDVYLEAAKDMGRELALRGLTCVYGGSDTGLMKVLADSALENGGKVIGVTVQALKDREIYHSGLTELHVMPNMHQRKALMAELSDGFIALPGGVGTLEELFEVYAWAHLGFHRKPFGLLNVNDYYSPLEDFLSNAEKEGFMPHSTKDMLIRAETPKEMLDLMTDKK